MATAYATIGDTFLAEALKGRRNERRRMKEQADFRRRFPAVYETQQKERYREMLDGLLKMQNEILREEDAHAFLLEALKQRPSAGKMARFASGERTCFIILACNQANLALTVPKHCIGRNLFGEKLEFKIFLLTESGFKETLFPDDPEFEKQIYLLRSPESLIEALLDAFGEPTSSI